MILSWVLGTISSNIGGWIFPRARLFSSRECTDQYSTAYLRGPSVVSRVFSMCSSLLFCTLFCEVQQPWCPWTPNTISSFQGSWKTLCAFLLCRHLETLSRQLAGVVIGLTLFVYHLSGISVLHWQLSSVLKPLFQINFSSFECFQ